MNMKAEVVAGLRRLASSAPSEPGRIITVGSLYAGCDLVGNVFTAVVFILV